MAIPRLRAATSPPISPPLSPTVSSSSVSRYSPVQRRTQPPKSQIPSVPRRLLVPTSSTKCSAPGLELRPVKSKSSSNRLTRSRADSAPPEPVPSESKDERRWFNCDSQFEVVEEQVQLSGYQIFAVEKWIVDRNRTTTLLTVYTGDPEDTISVTALAPSSLSSTEAQHQEWEKVIHELRKDGARPRETDKGIIMVTSLANFRSDYTVVYIPDGDFLAHRQQLYVNINLLRMGCSGRSALTLQEPSDTTKDRFISMFQFSDVIRAEDRFRQSVLELVKLIQCGLSLFDMFPIEFEEQDGLLCDATVDGIQKWIAEVGEPYMKVEPMERVADPSTVSALISLALSMRNKLSLIGYQAVPKDPFLHPRRFTRSLAAFVNQRLAQTPAGSTSAATAMCHHAYLNLALIKHIDVAYDKYRSSEAYKLHRVVLNKLDDLTTVTTSAMSSSKGASHGKSMSLSLSSKERDAESMLESTADLATFVGKVGFHRGKDCGASIRYLWTGRFELLERKRKESVWSDAEEEREREKERERSDSDEDGDLLGVFPWSSKVTKKIENWTGKEFGRNRFKKTSVDLSTKDKSPESFQLVPSVVVSGEPYDSTSGLSSGQVSPISPNASYTALGAFSSAHSSAVAVDDDDYSQRLAQLSDGWLSPLERPRKRTLSWADPVSAEELYDEVEVDIDAMTATLFPMGVRPKPLIPWIRPPETPKIIRTKEPKEPRFLRRKRSYSFDDIDFRDRDDVLSKERLQTDIDLCIQCLIMRRRKAHIEAVLTALQALIQSSSTSNEILRKYHEEHAALLEELSANCEIVADIEEAVSAADAASADTDALLYEANFLDIGSLWRMAQAPRLRVFAIRDRVFGARGRRHFALNADESKGHGRFNRVQRRLGGGERLVDFLGRTESDVEEEAELPEDANLEADDDSEDGEDDRVHVADEEGQLQALSSWLLTLFTKWGRVLGVGGAAPPEPATKLTDDGPPSSEKDASDRSDNGASPVSPISGEPPPYPRRENYLVNGHYHRLSTVGEEEEPISTPNTPSTPGIPHLPSGHSV